MLLKYRNVLITMNLWLWCSSREVIGSSNRKEDVLIRRSVHPSKLSIESRKGQVAERNEKSLLEGNESETGGSKDEDGTVNVIRRLECYVCSWSILGFGGNTSQNIDICTTNNFMVDGASVTPCEHGCQTYSIRTSEKEEIRNFYRNCLKSDETSKDLVDRCYKTKTIYGLEERCDCLSNLCNLSPSINLDGLNNGIFVLINFFIFSTFNFYLFG